jgi:MFS superfamily sulfate permease-like transporter
MRHGCSLGVLLVDTLPGLFVGIGVSILLLIYRASAPHVAELGRQAGVRGHYTDLARHEDDVPVPGLVILRPESGLYFANSEHVRNEIRSAFARSRPRAVVLDAETVPFIDVTAITMLDQLADDRETRARPRDRRRPRRDPSRPRLQRHHPDVSDSPGGGRLAHERGRAALKLAQPSCRARSAADLDQVVRYTTTGAGLAL